MKKQCLQKCNKPTGDVPMLKIPHKQNGYVISDKNKWKFENPEYFLSEGDILIPYLIVTDRER